MYGLTPPMAHIHTGGYWFVLFATLATFLVIVVGGLAALFLARNEQREKASAGGGRSGRRAGRNRHGRAPGDPDFAETPQAVALRAQSLVQMGRPQQAIDLLEPAIASSPDAFVLRQVAAIAYGKLERHDDAIVAARMAVAMNPESAQLQIVLAHRLVAANRSDEAVAPALDAVRSEPENSSAQALAAEAFRRSGEPVAAMEHAREAVRLNPERHQGVMGRVLLMYGRWEEAERALLRATVAFPEVWDPYFYFALALVPQARIAEASDFLEDFLGRHPDIAPILLLHDRLEQWQRTETALRQSLAEGGDRTRHEAELALLLMTEDRVHEAVEVLEAALERRPDDPDTRAELHQAYARIHCWQHGEGLATSGIATVEQDLENEYQRINPIAPAGVRFES